MLSCKGFPGNTHSVARKIGGSSLLLCSLNLPLDMTGLVMCKHGDRSKAFLYVCNRVHTRLYIYIYVTLFHFMCIYNVHKYIYICKDIYVFIYISLYIYK